MSEPTTAKAMYGSLAAKFDQVHQRDGGGGTKLDYLATDQVVTRLTEVLGPDNWEWEIREHGREGDTMWSLGRLTVHFTTRTVAREQFGECKVTRGMADGDARKGAASDALKKAATLVGVGLYLSDKDGIGAAAEPPIPCEVCGQHLQAVQAKDGVRSPQQLAAQGRDNFQQVLCAEHYKLAYHAAKALEAEQTQARREAHEAKQQPAAAPSVKPLPSSNGARDVRSQMGLPPEEPPAAKPLSSDAPISQIATLRAHLRRTGQDEATVCEDLDVKRLEDLSRERASTLIQSLVKRPSASLQPANAQ